MGLLKLPSWIERDSYVSPCFEFTKVLHRHWCLNDTPAVFILQHFPFLCSSPEREYLQDSAKSQNVCTVSSHTASVSRGCRSNPDATDIY
ncbi:hypothetical protein GJAV_G00249200 [Gymnothorax javanicus]|nr:hypothetical protein GJAV_G00249200 [Gymnothorax javanicus]